MNTTSKMRKQADSFDKKINHFFRDRETNTAKRQGQAQHDRIRGNRLQRTQQALRALADAHDAGTVPELLAALVTADQIAPLLHKEMQHTGFHGVFEGDKFSDNSAVAVALRAFLDGSQSEVDKAAADETARIQAIQSKEEALRFCGIPGFFPTPPAVIDIMLDYAWEVQDRYRVLEPSAGKGDICDAIRARSPFCKIHAVEVNHSLCEILELKGFDTTQTDFMTMPVPTSPSCQYDLVVMNPPFEKGQDADHVRHAYEFLKPGGRLVSIVSAGIMQRSDRKAREFRDWLEQREATGEDLPAGSFKSGFVQTGVATRIVLIIKPELAPVEDPEPPAAVLKTSRKAKKPSPQMLLSFLM